MNFEPGRPHFARPSAPLSSSASARPFPNFSAADLAFLNLPGLVPDGDGAPSSKAQGEALLQRLTGETSALRAELDASLPILSGPITEASYLRYCSALWGFYLGLERRLRTVPGLEGALADLPRRWKTELLELDLAELGMPIPELALDVCKEPTGPKLRGNLDLAHALGALYALELSTFSFRHIQRYLSHVLPSMTSRASHFLNCYGGETQARWDALCEQMLAALDARRIEPEPVLEGAVETLRAARAWFRRSFADEHLAAGDRRGAGAHKRASAASSWAAELERALLRTWPQLGLSLPPWSELERSLLLWVPWPRHEGPNAGETPGSALARSETRAE